MRQLITVAAALALTAGLTTAATNGRASAHHRSINTCLRRHGWPWGLRALERAELRVKHPNGLETICTRRDESGNPN